MTPGTRLLFHPTGVYHVHTDAEGAAGTWRPGAQCDSCPHKLPYAEAEESTKAERPEEKPK